MDVDRQVKDLVEAFGRLSAALHAAGIGDPELIIMAKDDGFRLVKTIMLARGNKIRGPMTEDDLHYAEYIIQGRFMSIMTIAGIKIIWGNGPESPVLPSRTVSTGGKGNG